SALTERLLPFKTADGRRLAVLFAVVYFSQGMYHVADQVVTLTLKETLGLTPAQVGTFGMLVLVPWVIKPIYGLVSDGFPLFGRRRKSYFLLSSALATLAGVVLWLQGEPTYGSLAIMAIVMGLGIAFTDVLTDAMMVENGKPLGLTGAFQSVQWTAINVAMLLVGFVGGYLAQRHMLHVGFLLAAAFPFLALIMGAAFIHEPRARSRRAEVREAWRGIRHALPARTMCGVARCVLLLMAFPPVARFPAFLLPSAPPQGHQEVLGRPGLAAFPAPHPRRPRVHAAVAGPLPAPPDRPVDCGQRRRHSRLSVLQQHRL